jgi:hypothetical protein
MSAPTNGGGVESRWPTRIQPFLEPRLLREGRGFAALLLAASLLAQGVLPAQDDAKKAPASRGTWTAPGPVAAWRFVPVVRGERRQDRLLWCSDDGRVTALELRGEPATDGPPRLLAADPLVFTLPSPATSLLVLARPSGDDGPTAASALWVADERGVHAIELSGPGLGAGLRPVAGDATHAFRALRPRFAQDLVRDLDGDGHDDLLLPQMQALDLWRVEGSTFTKLQSIPIRVSIDLDATANGVSDDLASDVSVPGLDLRDVDGDGKPDLVTRRGDVVRYDLQGDDGRFGARHVEVDLSRFQDRSASSGVELGETAVLGDDQVLQERDINGDGVPDHVIAHRRRIWVFHAAGPGAETPGPTFDRPVQALRVAEDASWIALLRADDDERPDLVVFKIGVPSATELALGLVRSIEVSIELLAYPCQPDGRFDRKPNVRRTLTIRLPSLVSLLERSQDLVKRFFEIVRKFRWSTFGDLDGDGRGDLVLMDENETRLEVWFGRAQDNDLGIGFEAFLKDLFFENPNTTFDIERILGLIADLFDQRSASLAGSAPPDQIVALPAHGRVRDLITADLDGDGAFEIVVVHARDDAPRVLSWTVLGGR